ncbi:phosphatidylglycerophosphatase [Limnochorda pilosa]|uniref:Phosphatidylglycerophosphatase n=1 Tax=Limnochorda pilosa TaxID=1555112 RepID=A0A0K2SKC4_LIMPI|nr:phosphatidylglycerophosphatase [Limnochorda pilosa]
MHEAAGEALRRRGVRVEDVVRVACDIARERRPQVTFAECRTHLEKVLEKREVLYAILTGVVLDELAEAGTLPEPLQEAIASDLPLYGIDEILATSITNIYGAVSLTRFGYLDKKKPGVVGDLNRHRNGRVHTFMDDLVAALVAATLARMEHSAQKGAGRLTKPEVTADAQEGLPPAASG